MRRKFMMLLVSVCCLTATMGSRFSCNNDNSDCEFFCFDDN